jgi:hypothetical protein
MTAGQRARARQPWEDELGRLRWLEQHAIGELAGIWRQRAKGLRETVTGASDYCRREELDDRAATWEQAAEELGEMLAASHAGPPSASPLDYAQWHLAEVGRILAGMAPDMTSVLEHAGAPE